MTKEKTPSEKQLMAYAEDLAKVYKEKKIQQSELNLLLEKEKYQRHLEAVFENVQDALITVDPEMRISEANHATEDICCFRPERLIGKKINEGITADCRCLQTVQQTLKTGKPIRDFRVECSQPANEDRIVIVTTSLLKDSGEQTMGALLVLRDVTRLINLERQAQDSYKFHDIIGRNRRMQELFELLKTLSDIDTTVLIRGESGTGKELVARALHYQGVRALKPMVVVNCSALAEDLLESELFGHAKGSFTGAIKNKTGRFEIADGGTVFLDEIGDISARTQLKLLRFLQERQFERVGDTKTITVNVRIIAATNRDLLQKIEREEFRRDLYYRLKVVELNLPSLRERSDDIPLLTEHFMRVFNKKFKKNIEGVADNVMNVFMHYSWPGNIRELEHVIEHAFVICRSEIITLEHLPDELQEVEKNKKMISGESYAQKPDDILRALDATGWNKSKAARKLGMSRPTLYTKIKEFKLVEPAG